MLVIVPVEGVLVVGVDDGDVIRALEAGWLQTHVDLKISNNLFSLTRHKRFSDSKPSFTRNNHK